MSPEELLGCYALVYDPEKKFLYCKNTITLVNSYRHEPQNKIMLKLCPLAYNDDLRDYFWISYGLVRILGHPDRRPLVKLLYDTKIIFEE